VPQWEYAMLKITGIGAVEGGGTQSWHVRITTGLHGDVLHESKGNNAPSTLEWCNWLGSGGWELVNTYAADRYFDNGYGRSDPIPLIFQFYFKREV
jgi:hypothetical protein